MQIEYKTRGIRSMMLAPDNDKSSILEAERQARRRAENDLSEAGRTIEQLRTRLAFAESALTESRQRVSELTADMAERTPSPPAIIAEPKPARVKAVRVKPVQVDAGEPIWLPSWGKRGSA